MDKKILTHFKKVDPLLYQAYMNLANQELMTIHLPADHFEALCREIIAQQLSTKVARVIFARLQNLFPDQKITAKKLLQLKHETLRAVGLSNSKTKYLLDLAHKVQTKQLSFAKLASLDDSSVISELTKVKGIGPWTAEMFLIFALERENIFSYGDFVLKKAITNLYGLQSATKEEIEKIVNKWPPYKSYACRILWRSLG